MLQTKLSPAYSSRTGKTSVTGLPDKNGPNETPIRVQDHIPRASKIVALNPALSLPGGAEELAEAHEQTHISLNLVFP